MWHVGAQQAAYLPDWSPAAHTRTQCPSWSPLVVSSRWSRSSRGCSPPGLPVSVSRSPWPPRRGQPLAERGGSTGGEQGENRGSRSACRRQTQTDRASVEPSTLTGPLHPSSVLPANPSESWQISSGRAGRSESQPSVKRRAVWRIISWGGCFLRKCPADVSAGQRRGEEELPPLEQTFLTVKLARTSRLPPEIPK